MGNTLKKRIVRSLIAGLLGVSFTVVAGDTACLEDGLPAGYKVCPNGEVIPIEDNCLKDVAIK